MNQSSDEGYINKIPILLFFSKWFRRVYYKIPCSNFIFTIYPNKKRKPHVLITWMVINIWKNLIVYPKKNKNLIYWSLGWWDPHKFRSPQNWVKLNATMKNAQSFMKPSRGDAVWTAKAAETAPRIKYARHPFRGDSVNSPLNRCNTPPCTCRRSLRFQITRNSVAASSRRVTISS